jgi:hypothetical protein
LNTGIGAHSFTIPLLQCSINDERTKTMFASLMRAFDRASLTYFLALAITPMLAVAAAGAIR